MKKVRADMTKTNILLPAGRQLRLDGVWQAHLGSFWNHFHLTGRLLAAVPP